jgi:hypothetical protein
LSRFVSVGERTHHNATNDERPPCDMKGDDREGSQLTAHF